MDRASCATGSAGHRALNTFLHGSSDLLYYPVLLFVSLCAIAVAGINLWQLGALGAAVHDSRSSQLAAEEPTRVDLLPPAGAARAVFDAGRLEDLRALPWVRAAGPRIELLVHASLGDREMLVPVEGRVAEAAPGREAWAWRSASTADRPGALVTRGLLERLGGRLGPEGPEPAQLSVRIGRRVDGVDQEYRADLPIRGVLRRQRDIDRIDVSIERIAELDRWCRGESVRGLPARPDAAQPDCDAVDVLVSFEHVDRLEDELEALGLERVGPVAPDSSGGVGDEVDRTAWIRVARPGGLAVERSVVGALDLARPTVLAARPVVLLDGADAFGRPLICESWAADRALLSGMPPEHPGQIVLPSSMLTWAAAFSWRASSIEIPIELRVDEGRVCSLRLEVAGVARSNVAYLHPELADEVRAFSAGELELDSASSRFFAPARRAADQAWVRATLFARDLEAIEPLVEHLRRDFGFQTIDRRAEHEAVQSLGRGLSLLVVALVAGCLLVAAVSVIGMTIQKVHARQFEIGLLRAHGIPAAQVVSMYAAQGLLIGLVAFALALAVQLGGAPELRAALARTFELPEGLLDSGSILGPPGLVALVLGVCLLFPIVGTALPAAWACLRTRPVDALGKRG